MGKPECGGRNPRLMARGGVGQEVGEYGAERDRGWRISSGRIRANPGESKRIKVDSWPNVAFERLKLRLGQEVGERRRGEGGRMKDEENGRLRPLLAIGFWTRMKRGWAGVSVRVNPSESRREQEPAAASPLDRLLREGCVSDETPVFP